MNPGMNPAMNPSMGQGIGSLTQQMGAINLNPMQQAMNNGPSGMAHPMQPTPPQHFSTTYGQGKQAQLDTTPTFKSPSNPGMFQSMEHAPNKIPESYSEWNKILTTLDLNSQCLLIKRNKEGFEKLSESERSQMLGDLMYALLSKKDIEDEVKRNMTSMFIDPEVLNLDEIIMMLVNDDVLNERIEEANDIMEDNREDDVDN